MDAAAILIHSLWAALFAAGLGIMLTAPARCLLPVFICALIGCGVRDVSIELGASMHWATVMGAAAVALLAAAMIRRQAVSPVVLICGVLPLGAAVAMFNLIFALVQVSTASGDALSEASLAASASLGKVLTTSLAIAFGLAAGMTVARLFRAHGATPPSPSLHHTPP